MSQKSRYDDGQGRHAISRSTSSRSSSSNHPNSTLDPMSIMPLPATYRRYTEYEIEQNLEPYLYFKKAYSDAWQNPAEAEGYKSKYEPKRYVAAVFFGIWYLAGIDMMTTLNQRDAYTIYGFAKEIEGIVAGHNSIFHQSTPALALFLAILVGRVKVCEQLRLPKDQKHDEYLVYVNKIKDACQSTLSTFIHFGAIEEAGQFCFTNLFNSEEHKFNLFNQLKKFYEYAKTSELRERLPQTAVPPQSSSTTFDPSLGQTPMHLARRATISQSSPPFGYAQQISRPNTVVPTRVSFAAGRHYDGGRIPPFPEESHSLPSTSRTHGYFSHPPVHFEGLGTEQVNDPYTARFEENISGSAPIYIPTHNRASQQGASSSPYQVDGRNAPYRGFPPQYGGQD